MGKQSEITDLEILPDTAPSEGISLYAASFFDADDNVIGFIFFGAKSEEEANEKVKNSNCSNRAESYGIIKISKPQI